MGIKEDPGLKRSRVNKMFIIQIETDKMFKKEQGE
jgi:hypothetical protein